jgi:hypothetical protein
MQDKIIQCFEDQKDFLKKSFSKSIPQTLFDLVQRSVCTLKFLDSQRLIDFYNRPPGRGFVSFILPSTEDYGIYYILFEYGDDSPLYKFFIDTIDNKNKEQQIEDLITLALQIIQKLKMMI